MEIDGDKLLENVIRDAVRDGVRDRFKASYNNPFDKLLNDAIAKHSGAISAMLGDAISACMNDEVFRQQLAAEVRGILAKTLVKRFGGELEKQVNVLKSNPVTRAKITLAIESITKEHPPA